MKLFTLCDNYIQTKTMEILKVRKMNTIKFLVKINDSNKKR
jgi:hypothetical protein